MEKHYNTLKELHNAFDAATTEEQKNAIRADYKKFEKELESQGRAFSRIFWLYEASREKENNLIDLNGDGLWSNDADLLIKDFRDCKIKEFTYSSTWSNANEIAWEFIKNGCTLKGMTMINTTKKIFSESYDQKPAYIFSID
ncbi:DUF7698 family protein [Phascolarctobacterium succinatutens]|uniref:DUF7698 family protein n=1 Tax=Phascolarctobacterium succinatutens TaxID=626940 RepID=UPI003D03D44F